MVVCINYANERYEKAQSLNSITAKKVGKADKVISYHPEDIDPAFREEHKDILSLERGDGYWLWKPYFIYKTLSTLNEGDILVYSDSGSYYTNSVRHLIHTMNAEKLDIMPFTLTIPEYLYTKRDAFILMECDEPEYVNSFQRLASFQVIRKTDYSISFVKDWLNFACDARIITDAASTLGENYPGFIDNRHDQSIFSLLSKKYGLPGFRDPSQFGNKYDMDNSPYPQIWFHHRNGNLGPAELNALKREKALKDLKAKLESVGLLTPALKVKRFLFGPRNM